MCDRKLAALLAILVGSVAALAPAGCVQDTAVHLQLSAPTDEKLNPLDRSFVASLTLIVSADGMPSQSQTRALPNPGDPMALGDVPIADGLRMTVVATTAAGRMVGFGRGDGPVNVRQGQDVDVVVRMRRPFAYLIGSTGLIAFDTTKDASANDYASVITGPVNPTAIAVTSDGAEIVVVDAGGLQLVTTETHMPQATSSVPLMPGARDMTVSPDGRWIVVAHDTGVSIVALGELRAGIGSANFVATGQVGAVAIKDATAWALVNANDGVNCAAEASLVTIDLLSGVASSPLPLGRAASDLAIDGQSGRVFIALPCDGTVATVSNVEVFALEEFMVVPGVTTVAAGGGRVWAVGHEGGVGEAHLLLAQRSIETNGATLLELPVPEERARLVGSGFEAPGQSAEQRVAADSVQATDLAVLPDGSRLAIVVKAAYHSSAVGPALFPYPSTVPALDISTWEYQLLDAPTGSPLQRVRTSCDVTWVLDSAFLDNFACTRSAGQDETNAQFVPGDIAVLYGDR